MCMCMRVYVTLLKDEHLDHLFFLVEVACVAVCCSALQGVEMRCSVLQCVAVRSNVLQCVAVCCSVLQCVAVCCSVSQCVLGSAVFCSVLQRGTSC